MTKPEIFAFSLSAKDEAFSPNDMEKTVNWLRDKQDEPNPVCYFREKSPKEVPSDSIMLFSFEAKIFGQATLRGTVKKVPLEEQKARKKAKKIVYKHFVNLDPATIKIFHRYPTKKKISEKLNKNFSPLITYFASDEYQEILKMAK